MEPVEINAGDYYLRQLRADERIDDRAAVLAAFTDPDTRRWLTRYRIDDLDSAGRYVADRTREWQDDRRCSWAVADPQTGAMLGEVGLKGLDLWHGTAEVSCWTHPAHRGRGVAVAALAAALRFGYGALDLHRVCYQHAEGNGASRRVAEKSGFRLEGLLRGAERVDDGHRDLLIWSRLATDPD
ncbi:GNAT family N-acetyltransferase [Solihabitans fulvus]|uniref:GNAT family N-acetyltransferase n=1 Tax=Solihabitans fulvus TaxID=1892852 RepID=A0A5B2WJX3_9PSEU|nr:GNAT family N-acetyltransferase [Solihabitans fulvus]KAA2251218.1 GNAT family N-acetyltransferase [Solihabitans fulvus]